MQWVSTKEVRISSNNESYCCFFFWNQPVTVPPPRGGMDTGGDGHGGEGTELLFHFFPAFSVA